VLQLTREVDVLRDVARHRGGSAGDQADRPRDQILAQGRDRVPARHVVTGAREREEERRACAVVVRGLDHGSVRDSARNRQLLQTAALPPELARVAGRYGRDELGGLGRAGEVAADVVESA